MSTSTTTFKEFLQREDTGNYRWALPSIPLHFRPLTRDEINFFKIYLRDTCAEDNKYLELPHEDSASTQVHFRITVRYLLDKMKLTEDGLHLDIPTDLLRRNTVPNKTTRQREQARNRCLHMGYRILQIPFSYGGILAPFYGWTAEGALRVTEMSMRDLYYFNEKYRPLFTLFDTLLDFMDIMQLHGVSHTVGFLLANYSIFLLYRLHEMYPTKFPEDRIDRQINYIEYFFRTYLHIGRRRPNTSINNVKRATEGMKTTQANIKTKRSATVNYQNAEPLPVLPIVSENNTSRPPPYEETGSSAPATSVGGKKKSRETSSVKKTTTKKASTKKTSTKKTSAKKITTKKTTTKKKTPLKK